MTQGDNTTRAWIECYPFEQQPSQPGRTLMTAHVGEVFISHICMFPHSTIGNAYFKSTNIMVYVEQGILWVRCFNTQNNQQEEHLMMAGTTVMHIPSHTSFAFQNREHTDAHIIVFSDNAISTSDDEVTHILYPT